MFDPETAELIRSAPNLTDVDASTLPQELTQIYAELTALRLRAGPFDADQAAALQRLQRLAAVYEGIVDNGSEGRARRAAAFVAGTCYQILSRIPPKEPQPRQALLRPSAIDPSVAAPLLFLIADQNPDAREAAFGIDVGREPSLLQAALVETVRDLAWENYTEILERGRRLQGLVPAEGSSLATQALQALFGLCWVGVVALTAKLLGTDAPASRFLAFETHADAFQRVVDLSSNAIDLPGDGARLISTFAGPRHLAKLLRHLSSSIEGAGIAALLPPRGADAEFWKKWTSHRAVTKPLLWKNHRKAIETGFLDQGVSSVLVLPTGAGKTTISELKVAATLAAGRKVFFLVPTLALVDQLRDELAESFPQSIGNVGASIDGDFAIAISGAALAAIEVMTPERCLALLSFSATALDDVGLVVFDECHLLSPQGGGKRSLDAMLCLLHITRRAPSADLLLLSAMITNSREVSDWLSEVTMRPCLSFEDTWKPSRQARGVVIYAHRDLFVPHRRRSIPRFEPKPTPYALFGLQNNWNPAAATDLRLVKLSDTHVELTGSGNRFTPNANAVAAKLASLSAASRLKTIVFVQQANHAPSTAKKIADILPDRPTLTDRENELWTAIVAEVGAPERSLVAPGASALPHNADMFPTERRLAESLFRRTDGVNVIVATPTLAQGMNLPAQIAILAGDKRHDDEGRTSLAAHEILNAAGRAGRAGFRANGIVLLIPEPVITFDAALRPEQTALAKLRTLLPPNDRSVQVLDPATAMLDKIQAGETADVRVRYFLSRLMAGPEDNDSARASAVDLVRRSLTAFQARSDQERAAFQSKLDALELALDHDDAEDEATVSSIAAYTGTLIEPLLAAKAKLLAAFALPSSIVQWSDWLIDFFADDRSSFQSLIGEDVDALKFVCRGKKTGGPLTASEFDRIKSGLRAWLTGRPLAEIELAVGVSADKLKHCPRARDLVLKIANRPLYVASSAIAEIVKRLVQGGQVELEHPAAAECLPLAVRGGFDTPEKVAYSQLRGPFRSRVAAHRAFAEEIGHRIRPQLRDFAAARMQVALLISNADVYF